MPFHDCVQRVSVRCGDRLRLSQWRSENMANRTRYARDAHQEDYGADRAYHGRGKSFFERSYIIRPNLCKITGFVFQIRWKLYRNLYSPPVKRETHLVMLCCSSTHLHSTTNCKYPYNTGRWILLSDPYYIDQYGNHHHLVRSGTRRVSHGLPDLRFHVYVTCLNLSLEIRMEVVCYLVPFQFGNIW